ncbi:MAG: hypothetical protein JWO37_1578 [Acidimicrobiales bacterium]|nr:hypothetical protein [Acidimicrobiales bacterium]
MTPDQRFRRTYRVVLLAVLIGFVLIGGLIGAFGTRKARVEGVAERWVTAVSDITRKGVGTDARKRIAAHGDVELVGNLVDLSVNHHKKSAFTALEVGKADLVMLDVARVPLKVEYREAVEGSTGRRVLTLQRSDGIWRVIGVDAADPALRVPSDGGPAVTRAPLGLYAGTLLLGVVITLAAGALIRATTGPTFRELPAT